MGSLLLLPPWWTSCKSQSKLFPVACDAHHTRVHAPHLPTVGTCPSTQRLAPGWGRGLKGQVEALRKDLREGKGHQGPTDHYEVKNVPEVAEVGALVQDEPQINHLWGGRDSAQVPQPCPEGWPHPSSLRSRGNRKGHGRQCDHCILQGWHRGPRTWGGVRSPHPVRAGPSPSHER